MLGRGQSRREGNSMQVVVSRVRKACAVVVV
jgi:hypothetical protein